MHSARSLVRLCSRPSSLASASTPVRRIHRQLSHIRRPSPQPQVFRPQLCRHAFSTTAKRPEPAPVRPGADSAAPEQQDPPQYQMTFTCKVCTTRSSHKISKQGYHNGTVLISCPGCKNRHLISDHLKIFSEEGTSFEDALEGKGQLIKRGKLSDNGQLELWDDGTQTKYVPPAPKSPTENATSDNAVPGSSFRKSE